MNQDKKVVAIGGGTGLSTMLRGLKLYTENITAIVTVADDGGSSGKLRNDLGMLPPGDIRNCITALADIEPIMEELLHYRFTDGDLKGHSFGNLFLAALNGISDEFDEAVQKMSSVLAVVGQVLPVTNDNITLNAKLEDGSIINGESSIGHRSKKDINIDHVWLSPENPKAVPAVIEAILNADIIVLGPGSLYTSVIPNLLVDGVSQAIKNSNAIKIYVCNIMSQAGETIKYTVHDHLKAIERHTYKGVVDFVIANSNEIPQPLIPIYKAENAEIIEVDEEAFNDDLTVLVKANLLNVRNGQIRHHISRLAHTILLIERRVQLDKKINSKE